MCAAGGDGMLRRYGLVSMVGRIIEEAAGSIINAFIEQRILQEDDLTSRLLGVIEREFNGRKIKGIVWHARRLTSNVKGSEEARFEADFVGVLDIQINGYNVQKGFLAQAKLVRDSWPRRHEEWERLIKQCRHMLNLSPHAFVFFYSREGIYVVPAIACLGIDEGGSFDFWEVTNAVYSKRIGTFFEEHLKSFIGDPQIRGTKKEELQALMMKYEVPGLLYLAAREREDLFCSDRNETNAP
jgi:hypothetical protein